MRTLILTSLAFIGATAHAAIPSDPLTHLAEAFTREFAPEVKTTGVRVDYDLLPDRGFGPHTERTGAALFRISFGARDFKSTFEADAEIAALVLCHETAHVFGHMRGGDSSEEFERLRHENESDVWATRACLPQILAQPELQRSLTTPNADLERELKLCGENSASDVHACANTLRISLKLAQQYYRDALETQGMKPGDKDAPQPPAYDTPDLTPTKRTQKKQMNYQCRLDSFVAGVLHRPNPSCWFVPGH